MLAISLLLFLCVVPSVAAAESTTTTGEAASRPKIGLSLGGGGARGIAHVGVLQVLEDLHVPVDYIAGTSMGAIVGSLYALGLSADEIEEHLLHIDWADVFSDRVDRQARSFRRKEDDQPDILGLEFGLTGKGFVPPRSLATGQNLAFALPVPGLHTEGRDSFDDLPIPFRAIASNVRTGEPEVIDSGSLFRAVRASMTVPLAFPPIESDSLLLIDGGLTLNNPVQVVRDMGADIVIAVSVDEFPELRTQRDLDSVKQYISQLLAVALNEQVQNALAQADVVIRPPLEGILMDDFKHAATIVDLGHAAAEEMRPAIQKLAVSAEEYASIREERGRKERSQWQFDRLILENESRVPDAVLRRRLRLDPDDVVDLTTLRRRIEDVYDLAVFEAVEFDINRVDGDQVVTVKTTEKPYVPNIFHVGVRGHATFRGDTQFSLGGRLTRMEMNDWGAEWRNDVVVGTVLLLSTELYQPIGLNRYWFVAPAMHVGSTIQYIYERDSRSAVQRFEEFLGGADVGLALGRVGEVRTGLRWGWIGSGVVTGDSPLPSFNGSQAFWQSQFQYDMLDAADFPHYGGEGMATFTLSDEAIGADFEYQKVAASWTQYHTLKRATGFFSLAAGSALGSPLPSQEQFLLGGFGSFVGYNTDQLRGNYVATVRLGSYVRVGSPIDFIGTQWYVGGMADVGNVWLAQRDVRGDDLRFGGAVFVGADTIIGPAFVSGALATEGAANVYITLGIPVGVSL